MQNALACRVNRLDLFPVVADAGLRYVEIGIPSQEGIAELEEALQAHGLTASSVSVSMDVRTDDGVAQVGDTFARVKQLGASVVFTSVRADDADRDTVYRRLRQVGDAAASHGITVALETHPDLMSEGALARQTLEAVGHPHIRANFDPANLYYYNHDVDSLNELQAVLPYVAAVHLKDTTGRHRSADFPPVGQGVVPFPDIFRTLSDHGYDGPFTFEIEGNYMKGVDDRLAAFGDFLKQSVAYCKPLLA